MSRLSALLLLCFSALCHAQPAATKPAAPTLPPTADPVASAPTGVPRWLSSPCIEDGPLRAAPTTASKPICLPAPKGAGTAPVIETNDFGAAAGWWCKQGAGKPPLLYLYAVRWEALTPALVTDLVLGALSGSQTTAIQATQLKHQSRDIRDMCEVWGPAAGRLIAARP